MADKPKDLHSLCTKYNNIINTTFDLKWLNGTYIIDDSLMTQLV